MTPPRLALGLALGFACLPAAAAPCASFADVFDTDSYCQAVEWLRNRAVTTGCDATHYCPAAPVSRSAMALFMHRMGKVLTPQIALEESALGSVDPDASPALCQTVPTAAAAYPRQALVSVAFGGLSAGALGYSVRPVVSIDNGATWQPLGAVAIRDSIAGVAWGNTSLAGTVQIPAAQSVRFAARVERESGAAGFTQARCQVVASVMNANGTSSPFDLAASR